jgi:tRNA pseudouridine55 synthase
MEKYIILEKKVGETPLSCAEAYRVTHPELEGVPMAYAGRLDPMASGKLLILLGEECKNQTNYHGLDKKYEFSILLGIESDSLDVLGRLSTVSHKESSLDSARRPEAKPKCRVEASDDSTLIAAARSFVGVINQPYPIFSSKTVQGKPLHTWTMEGRLHEIEIPTKESTVYELELTSLETISKEEMVTQALKNINSIPPVTELRKALGNDFRRTDVRKDWNNIPKNNSLPDTYQIARFRCVSSSGTYMRTLASEIAKKLGTVGLAWSIHRSIIGQYDPSDSVWERTF